MYLRYRSKLRVKSETAPPKKKTPQVELYKEIKREQKRCNKTC